MAQVHKLNIYRSTFKKYVCSALIYLKYEVTGFSLVILCLFFYFFLHFSFLFHFVSISLFLYFFYFSSLCSNFISISCILCHRVSFHHFIFVYFSGGANFKLHFIIIHHDLLVDYIMYIKSALD